MIDTGPDFRQQMLRHEVGHINGILLTHEHNDHIVGIDDVRPYNFAQAEDMEIYGLSRVTEDLRQRFRYAFESTYPGAPKVHATCVEPWQRWEIGDLSIQALPVKHGKMDILGYMLGEQLVYITDVSALDEQVVDVLRDKEVVILSALHHTKHHSHFTLEEAVEVLDRASPRQAYLVHMSHYMGLHQDVDADLPPWIRLGYDGLSLTVSK